MKNFYLLLILLITAGSLTAQNRHMHRCGYDLYKANLIKKHPELRERFDAPFQDNRIASRNNDIYTLPVVVHIVYQNEDQNISDERVARVIENATRDFRHLGDNIGNLRPEFDSLVGDPRIEFKLVHIERVQTDTTFQLDFIAGTLPDHVKRSALGGSDAWDTDHYLNIWVCALADNALLGYAYPPAGLDHWPEDVVPVDKSLDGIVMTTDIFDTDGTFPFNGDTLVVNGRSVVHEIGHYLGLRHIWGDGPLTFLGIPDCDVDDGVSDTPNQGLQSNFACDDQQNTCIDDEGDLFDMWENFMDYSREECQSGFTHGQIAIMRSVIENERSQLLLVSTENIPEESVTIYPNPTSSSIYIKSAMKLPVHITLYDQVGRTMMTKTLKSYEPIDLSDMEAGMYHMEIFNGVNHVVKSVIKR